jgi:hypothetical protein
MNSELQGSIATDTRTSDTGPRKSRLTWTTGLSLSAGLLGTALIFILGDPLGGDGPHGSSTGSAVSQALLAHESLLRTVAALAGVACAGLIVASVRVGGAAAGTPGRVITGAGTAVSVLMAGYYASFAAGVAVASYSLSEAGPGLGEATLVVLNAFSLAQFGPALALLVATAVAPGLPRTARITAAILSLVVLIPFTTWIANLILPLWLGVTAAGVRERQL